MNRFMTRSMPLMLGLAFALSLPSFALDVALHYHRHEAGPGGGFFPYGYTSARLSDTAPSGSFKLPDLTGQKPCYASVRLGDDEYHMIFAREGAGAGFYNRLYFDANHDNDLTNDPVLKSRTRNNGSSTNFADFPALDLTLRVGGVSLPYSIWPMLYRFSNRADDARNLMVQMRVNCWYEGELDTGGQKYRIFLGDQNGNGRFGEPLAVRPRNARIRSNDLMRSGDSLYIVTNEKLDYYCGQMFSNWLWLGDTLYTMQLAPDQSKLTLSPVDTGLAPLKIGKEVERMQLCTDDGKRSVVMYRPRATIRLPKGSYRLFSYQLFRTDPQGDRWRLAANGTWDGAVTAVGGAASRRLPFGEPYQPVVTMRNAYGSSSMNNTVSLSCTIVGSGNEKVSDLTRVSGTATKIAMSTTRGRQSRPKEPTYRIITADNEVVASGKFDYG